MPRPSAIHITKVFNAWLKALASLFVALLLTIPVSVAQDEKAITITDAVPLSPQPKAETIMPGLAVNYLYQKFYTLDEIYDADVDPTPGEPIPSLNQVTETDPNTGEDKTVNVLTSDQSMMVGAFIRGLILFQEPGKTVLRVNSNDGVRVWVGGAMIWEDPEVHFDRLSPPIEFIIQETGWYELKIDYYQKKGTAALQLLWTPPGADGELPVPAEAFGHIL